MNKNTNNDIINTNVVNSIIIPCYWSRYINCIYKYSNTIKTSYNSLLTHTVEHA